LRIIDASLRFLRPWGIARWPGWFRPGVLAELRTTVDLRKEEGLEAALGVVRTHEGKHTMDEIRASIAALKHGETELLNERERSANTGARRAIAIIVVGNVLGFALLAAALVIIRRDERRLFLEALERAHGNRTEAARLLGISRATFYRRLAALGIRPQEDPGTGESHP
jgi:DNA-binding NtrC family response regulator